MNSVKKAAAFLMFFTLISKVTGFFRDMFLSYYFGTSGISDAYLISVMIPQTIFSLIGAAIASGLIPIYTSIEESKGIDEADNFVRKLLTINIIFSFIIIIFVLFKTDIVILIFASGLRGETLEIATNLTRITILGVFANSFTNVFAGYLQVKGKFNLAASFSIISNIIIITSIIYSFHTDYIYLGYGFVLAMYSQIIFMMIVLKRFNFKVSLNFNFTDEFINKFFMLAIPIFIGVFVDDLNKIVDKNIASLMLEGGISALNYAGRISKSTYQVIIMAFSTIIFPKLSRLVQKNDKKSFENSLNETLNLSTLLVLPISVGVIFFSKEIVTLLYARGNFDSGSILLTSVPLLFYSLSILPSGIKQIMMRAHYAYSDTKSTVINSMIATMINIILNIYVYKFTNLGIWALAMTTSISTYITTILLFINFSRKHQKINYNSSFKVLIKILILSIIIIFISKILTLYLNRFLYNNLATILGISLAVFLYVWSIQYLKIREIDDIRNYLKEKFHKNK